MTSTIVEVSRVARGTPAFRKINLAVFAAGYSTFLLMYAVQPLLPIFAAEFHISAAESSLALSLTTGCLAISMLVVGAVAEGWSRKPIMSVSLMTVALLTLVSSVIPAWPAFLVVRTVEGIALAGLPALAMAYVGEEIHPDAIGVSMGLYVGSGALGGMTGRLLTGILADLFSWRPALAIVGGIGIVASVIFTWMLPPSARFRPQSISVASLLADYKDHLRDPIIVALVAEAFAILGSLVTVYNYTSFRLLAPPYSLSQAAVGSVFGLYLLGFFSSWLIGMLSHRFSRAHLLRSGLATMLAGVLITAARPLPAVIAGIALVTIGFFAAQSVASSWIGLRASKARAQASALYLFFYYMGASIAGSVGGFFWTGYAWNGVVGFLAVLLLIALTIAGTWLRSDPAAPMS